MKVMKSGNRARPLTESAVALALGAVMWWVFTPMPGIGPYFKYMSASLIAIVGARHGIRWSAATAAALNLLVGLTLGLGELLNCAFLVTPMAVMLPARSEGNRLRGRGKRDTPGEQRTEDTWDESHIGMRLGYWWAMLLSVYALAYSARVWAVSILMDAEMSGVVRSMASANYRIFQKFWTSADISADIIVAASVDWMWLILPFVGMCYGAMLYFVNRPAYYWGLLLLKRTRLDWPR